MCLFIVEFTIALWTQKENRTGFIRWHSRSYFLSPGLCSLNIHSGSHCLFVGLVVGWRLSGVSGFDGSLGWAKAWVVWFLLCFPFLGSLLLCLLSLRLPASSLGCCLGLTLGLLGCGSLQSLSCFLGGNLPGGKFIFWLIFLIFLVCLHWFPLPWSVRWVCHRLPPALLKWWHWKQGCQCIWLLGTDVCLQGQTGLANQVDESTSSD